MNSRELAGQLVVGLEGAWPSLDELNWLDHWRPGGVILFGRNVLSRQQLRALCRLIKEILPDAEIMADHEGGPVSQLAAALGRPPAPWTLGNLEDVDLTREVHAESGRRALEVGVTRLLAPCADVMTEPRNPVIGVRAFGNQEDLVGHQAAAAVRGLAEAGIGSCLKHWPGHGGSQHDSHLVAAGGPADGMTGPFRAGLESGCDSVLVGHLVGGKQGLPATLDRELLTRWREEMEQLARRPVRLLADDVTMGGLRPAMARLNVELDDGKAEGLIDPAVLPLTWLRALADAGLDLLLIRGIPWGAFPGPREPNFAAVPEVNLSRERGSWPTGIYDEVRQLQDEALGLGFSDPGQEMAWLDLTVGDRWEDASCQKTKAGFADRLGKYFADVSCWEALPPARNARISRLLITSHRPLPLTLSGSEHWTGRVAGEGHCRVWGHPSLGAAMVRVLGSRWQVTSSYEIDWTDGLLG